MDGQRVWLWSDAPLPAWQAPPRLYVRTMQSTMVAGRAATTVSVHPTTDIPAGAEPRAAGTDRLRGVIGAGNPEPISCGRLLVPGQVPDRDADVRVWLDRAHIGAWRATLAATPAGAGMAAVLEQRPDPIDVTDAGPRAVAGAVPLWANALVDSLAARQALISHLQARQAADLDQLAARYPGRSEFLATEIAQALGIAESTAKTRISEARAMIRRLPGTFAALDARTITDYKARAVATETATVEPEVAAAVERRVLDQAAAQTTPELRASLRRGVIAADPDGADQRHRKAAADRRIVKRAETDGMASLWMTASAIDIATIWDALTALADAAVSDSAGSSRSASSVGSRSSGPDATTDDPAHRDPAEGPSEDPSDSAAPFRRPSLDNRRVDALIDICADILSAGGWNHVRLPEQQRRRPHVHITIPDHAIARHRPPQMRSEASGSEPAAQAPAGAAAPPTDASPGATRPTAPPPTTDVIPASARPTAPPPTAPPPTASPAAGICELAGYGPITTSQALSTVADGLWRALLCDRTTGTLLDYGRSTYRPPADLVAFVTTRDQTCIVPGRRQPAWRCDIDHREAFHPGRSEGGSTAAGWCDCLCRHHHRAKDAGGFKIHRQPDGTVRFTTPLGRTTTRPPTRLWWTQEHHPPRSASTAGPRSPARAQPEMNPGWEDDPSSVGADHAKARPEDDPPPF